MSLNKVFKHTDLHTYIVSTCIHIYSIFTQKLRNHLDYTHLSTRARPRTHALTHCTVLFMIFQPEG